MKHPHGTFDNTTTMRRERWFNGELKFHSEAHRLGDGWIVRDYFELFARREESPPWGTFPDLDCAEASDTRD